jgi:hypothetical protein
MDGKRLRLDAMGQALAHQRGVDLARRLITEAARASVPATACAPGGRIKHGTRDAQRIAGSSLRDEGRAFGDELHDEVPLLGSDVSRDKTFLELDQGFGPLRTLAEPGCSIRTSRGSLAFWPGLGSSAVSPCSRRSLRQMESWAAKVRSDAANRPCLPAGGHRIDRSGRSSCNRIRAASTPAPRYFASPSGWWRSWPETTWSGLRCLSC